MKIFNSLGHFFAWLLHSGLPKAETVAQDVEKVAASPLASAIASLLGSKGAAVQSGIEAIAGDVLNAFGDAGAAIGADGLNVKFDAATVTAIKAIYGDLGSLFGKGQAS
ncbi:MAG TPA: hypothetical protein VIC54_11365 [Terriglobales bacterium]|jgi:hypothetical protein